MPIRIRVTNFLRYSSILPKPGLHRLSRFHSRFSRIDSASIAASFVEAATHPSSKYQIYLSNSTDPFLNLSIEHYLLEKAPTYSTILFLYTNRPSLVIGRNQNPWVEIDLKALEGAPALGLRSNMEKVDLLRRRSGGGTVFHDYGNLNFCVICPRADFTRDKHAEMVTRAIRKLNPRARVNQRHDIVLDQGSLQDNDENQPDPEDMHRSAYHSEDINLPPLKVSGSAYKILNGSALHHGTCLVTSLNLKTIPTLLNSPAKHFMEAKGAASCPSPVGNIHEVDAESVYDMVIKVEFLIVDAFAAMYGISQSTLAPLRAMNENNFTHRGSDLVCGFVGGELMKVPAIMSGMEELKSPKWIYMKTPKFEVSSYSHEGDRRERPPLPDSFPPSGKARLRVTSGLVTLSQIRGSEQNEAREKLTDFNNSVVDTNVQQLSSFLDFLQGNSRLKNPQEIRPVLCWLDSMFGKRSR